MADERKRELPLSRVVYTGGELPCLTEALRAGHLAGDGAFSEKCRAWVEAACGCGRAYLTPSATGALEMAARLLDLSPGDEVVVPDFAFPSTAGAFALFGAVPVFADICPDTLNLDPEGLDRAASPRTRAVVVLHYGGVPADMDRIGRWADSRNVAVIEDAALALGSAWQGRPAGSFGVLGALSFHETKPVSCGEGGALLVNDSGLADRAGILRQFGTDREAWAAGRAPGYSWQEPGSSQLLGELAAAFLWAQMQGEAKARARREALWEQYHEALGGLEDRGLLKRPTVPPGAVHNAGQYHILLNDSQTRERLLSCLKEQGILAAPHYRPLHQTPAGKQLGRKAPDLTHSISVAGRILRLPLWSEMTAEDVGRVAQTITTAI